MLRLVVWLQMGPGIISVIVAGVKHNVTNRHIGYPSLLAYAEIDDDVILLHAQSSQFL